MILHISKVSETNPLDKFPTLTMCGKIKKRESRIVLPLACKKCAMALLDEVSDD